ncbi:MAG: histidine kinase [Pseudomonadales bacterium]|nr:histidine kinase [Pseudomonadales bacterium]
MNPWWWLPGALLLGAVWLSVLLLCGRQVRKLRVRLRAQDEALYRVQRQLADSRLQGLRMQLDPHFLFNTLNGLSVLIDKQENARARRMLDELSAFLRQTLRTHREKWISLEQELDYARQYLRIEQYRFGNRLLCFEDCEPLALTAKVPPMLLQPLFENAIVHGLADKEGECRLGFECRLYDRYLIIMIFDNGDGFDPQAAPAPKGGVGLCNVRERLQEAYGTHYSLRIEKLPDGTRVTLKLPSYKDSQF